jgi:nitrite reductase (cytochrome c-552)
MSDTPDSPNPPPAWRGIALFFGVAGAIAGLGLLSASIMERRAEGYQVAQPKVAIAAYESDNSKWGVNSPREWSSYLAMADADHPTHTKQGGSFKRDLLEETPANVVLFAGYAFAKDYKQARGHIYAVDDVKDSGRYSAEKTPGTCWSCKSPDVPRMMEKVGVEQFYKTKAEALKPEIKNPIGCLDCHDEQTMALRISRPALKEAWQRQGKDIAKATHQEMRTLVCAQCHVEYYFKDKENPTKPGTYLTFPWDKGMAVEDMESYYDDMNFADWQHAISKTRMVKMQHPDYEVYTKGIHAYRNVSCADCHMPYKTEGGAKFTDHHIQSPLLNIDNSCAVCHRWSESDIRNRVESIQDKVHQGRVIAENALSKAHFDIAAAMQAGATDDDLKEARKLVRAGQLRWDYVAANNGMGFHAPQECQRILAVAADLAQQSRLASGKVLASKGHLETVAYPDTSSKVKAQAVLKLFLDGKPPALIAGYVPPEPAAAPIAK